MERYTSDKLFRSIEISSSRRCNAVVNRYATSSANACKTEAAVTGELHRETHRGIGILYASFEWQHETTAETIDPSIDPHLLPLITALC